MPATTSTLRLDTLRASPHFILPVVAVAGAFLAPFHWWYPLAAVGIYFVRMFVLTAAYHRYFAHRAFKTGRVFQFVLAFAGASCAQRGPLWWAAHHRTHHRYADTDLDVHSPVRRGFWWAHMGWLLFRGTDTADMSRVKDLSAFPELRWVEKYHLVPPVLLALAMLLIGGSGLLVWGFFVSTTVLWHATYCINSLAHRWGTVRYSTGDGSRNNGMLALLTLGEGWHNNHHHFMSSARQGFFWWEVDITYYLIRAMAAVGLVWDVREVPKRMLGTNLVRPQPSGKAIAPALPEVHAR